MDKKFLNKKIFVFLLLFFFVFGQTVSAQATVTENVSINAIVEGATILGKSTAGTMAVPRTAVRFSGEAYPNAIVTVMKEGKEITSVLADTLGYFTITLEELYNNNVLYSLYAKDVEGNRSLLINYPIVVYVGYLTHLSGIRFAPTINTDKAEVKAGDYLSVSGYAMPNTNIEIIIDGKEKKIFTLTSHANGSYLITIPLGNTPKGDYIVQAKYIDDMRISKLVRFVIGELNILNVDAKASIPGDCNVDHIINLVDFSVLAFWYGKENPPPCVDTNKDNVINLVDFSILAFYWTG